MSTPKDPEAYAHALATAKKALVVLAAWRDGRIEGVDHLDAEVGVMPLMDSLTVLHDPKGENPFKAEALVDDYVEAYASEGATCYNRHGERIPNWCAECGQCTHEDVDDAGNCRGCGTAEIGCGCEVVE